MKTFCSAIVLAAVATLVGLVSPAAPASAGTDTTPPEVGSCHDLTYDEGYEDSDPDPAVDCTGRHTTVTIATIELSEAPSDWSDPSTYPESVFRTCSHTWESTQGDNPKLIQRAAYTWFWFSPTRVQREAGALWVRCDIALLGGDRLLPLPQDLTLNRLPLPDQVAMCRQGKRADYAYTACSQHHQFRASLSIKYPTSSYPGVKKAKQFALRKCRARAAAPFFYLYVSSRAQWHNGYRWAVCLFQD